MYDAELEAIFDNYIVNFVKEPDFLIGFYEENELKFSSVMWFDHDALFKYESVAGWYLWALVHKKKYNHVISKAPAILSKIEANQNNLNIDPPTDKGYHFIIKQRAFAKYSKFMFHAAAKDFARLFKYNPENKNYKIWIDMSMYRFYMLVLTALSYLIVFGQGYYKNYLPAFLRIAVPAIGLLCCAVAWWFEVKARRIWKNSQSPLRKV